MLSALQQAFAQMIRRLGMASPDQGNPGSSSSVELERTHLRKHMDLLARECTALEADIDRLSQVINSTAGGSGRPARWNVPFPAAALSGVAKPLIEVVVIGADVSDNWRNPMHWGELPPPSIDQIDPADGAAAANLDGMLNGREIAGLCVAAPACTERVLSGGKRALERAIFVEAAVTFSADHTAPGSFERVDPLLRSAGFELIDILDTARSNAEGGGTALATSRLEAMTVLYMRPPVDVRSMGDAGVLTAALIAHCYGMYDVAIEHLRAGSAEAAELATAYQSALLMPGAFGAAGLQTPFAGTAI